MENQYIECVDKYQADFLSSAPEAFNNEADGYATLCLNDIWGSLYYEGGEAEKPIMFFRHSNKDSYRFGGIVELGDNYIMPQKGGYHFDDIAQKDTIVSAYKKLSDDPLMYGFGSEEPFSEYRFYLDHVTIREGDILELTAVPLPVCFIDHGCLFPPLVQFSQNCIFKGKLDGKPVHGLGSYDRLYMPRKEKQEFGENLGYFCAMGSGLREDGRYEICLATIDHKGTSVGIYWLEGEEPVISYDVKMEAEWERLPYTDDGTCIYKDAIFRFAGIEFHVNGKWGTKGFTEKPRIERHGQSQVFGTWYVGDTPYRHQVSNSFNENMDCYDYKLQEMGFEVIDK